MKLHFFRIACVFIWLTSCCAPSSCSKNKTEEDHKWDKFKDQGGRKYKNEAEEARRRENWKKKMVEIDEHNKQYANGNVSYMLGENNFSDLTYEEFAKTYLTLQVPKMSANASRVVRNVSARALPTSLDYSTDPCMAAIKDQRSCGSCYAFSAISPLEFDLCLKKGNKLTTLSEQQVVDCTSCFLTGGNNGCGGGLYTTAWEKMQSNPFGINTDTTYPYHNDRGLCLFRFNMFARAAGVASYKWLTSRSTSDIMTALSNKQLVAVGLAANSKFQAYKTGIFTDTDCNSIVANHAIVLVGYGTESGIDYWLARNSWGTGWGISGYLKIKRGTDLCHIESYPAVVTASS